MKYLFSKLFIFSALILSLTFCQKSYDVADLKTKIDDMNNIIVKAMMENDSEAYLTLYTEEGYSLPSYEPMMVGMEAMKKAAEKNKDNPMKMTKFTLATLDVFTSGNLAVEVGTYDLAFTMPDMPAPMEDKGKYVTIYEIQKDGSLKIKLETWNTDTNPWAMMGDMGKMDHEKPDMKKKKMN